MCYSPSSALMLIIFFNQKVQLSIIMPFVYELINTFLVVYNIPNSFHLQFCQAPEPVFQKPQFLRRTACSIGIA